MNSIYASIFGESPATQQARANRDSAFQAMLDTRKKAAEEQKTADETMARYNAFGNLLTTMVQPLGWGVGGGFNGGNTGGVQKYDDRQYLAAFNRAVKDAENLRNIGTQQEEYRLKLADEDYKRAIANDQAYRNAVLTEVADTRRARLKQEADARNFELRSKLNQEQIAGRIAVAEATARAKYQFRTTGGGRASDSVRDNLIKRANAAYAAILQDYNKKKMAGIEGLQEPPTYDDFLQQFGAQNGVSVTTGNTQSAAPATTTATAPATTPATKTATTAAASPAKTTETKSGSSAKSGHVTFKTGGGYASGKKNTNTKKNDKSSVTLE